MLFRSHLGNAVTHIGTLPLRGSDSLLHLALGPRFTLGTAWGASIGPVLTTLVKARLEPGAPPLAFDARAILEGGIEAAGTQGTFAIAVRAIAFILEMARAIAMAAHRSLGVAVVPVERTMGPVGTRLRVGAWTERTTWCITALIARAAAERTLATALAITQRLARRIPALLLPEGRTRFERTFATLSVLARTQGLA